MANRAQKTLQLYYHLNGVNGGGGEVPEPEMDYFYVKNTYNGTNTLTLTSTKLGNPPANLYSTSVEYSKDGVNWTSITFSTSTPYNITMNVGDKVYFRNNNGKWGYFYSGSNYYLTTITTNYSSSVGGILKTLLDYTDLDNIQLKPGCFFNCFRSNKGLTDASRLIMPTETTKGCFEQMFRGCSSLITPPQLPATELADACYAAIFHSCTSLVSSPILVATTVINRAYQSMFYNCSSLSEVTTYADNISATDCTKDWLYGVASTGTFNNLGSATYTKNSASGIPVGWTEVKPEPEEPETDYFYIENTFEGTNTLYLRTDKGITPSSNTYASSVEYSKDKENWTSITLRNRPEITMQASEKVYFRNNTGRFNYYNNDYTNRYATYFTTSQSCSAGGDLRSLLNYEDIDNVVLTPGCFYHLFYSNSKLTDITNLKLPATTLSPYCYANLFESCSSLTTVPSDLLPATTLAKGCYYGIFGYCYSLTKAPTLPATVLTPYCYTYAFEECSSLSEVTTYANDISAQMCIEGWLFYVADSGTFRNLGTAEYIEGESGIPTGWTVVTQ